MSIDVGGAIDDRQMNMETSVGVAWTFGGSKPGDSDGVYDGLDRCPDTAKGVKVDENGCPVFFEKERAALVLEGVNFECNSAELTSPSKGILDKVAMTLKEWPEVRVEVAGDTDSVGSEEYNQDLSQKRAESVRAYLVSKGANAANLVARGYGEGSPTATNDTDEDRDQNRRVELKKLSN